jgi:hypothetical protein
MRAAEFPGPECPLRRAHFGFAYVGNGRETDPSLRSDLGQRVPDRFGAEATEAGHSVEQLSPSGCEGTCS